MIVKEINKCKNCIFAKRNMCNITTSSEDYCSQFKQEIYKCEFCNKDIITPVVLLEEDSICLLCENCRDNLSACSTCENGSICAFEQDTTCTIPAMIQKKIPQGPNGYAIVTVKNPERVKALCPTCICYKNNNCCKENGTCDNYKIPKKS